MRATSRSLANALTHGNVRRPFFTVAEYEEVCGVDYTDLLQLVDHGLVTPIRI